MSTYRYHTIVAPSRGKTRALSVSGTQSTYALADIFGTTDSRDGEYYTASCNQVFYLQTSADDSDVIGITDSQGDDSDVGEDPDAVPGGPFAANTPHRFLIARDDTQLHIIAAGSGILRIWKSSSNKV